MPPSQPPRPGGQSWQQAAQVRTRQKRGNAAINNAEWLAGIEGPAGRASRPIKHHLGPSCSAVLAGHAEQTGEPRGWSRSQRPGSSNSLPRFWQATELAGQLRPAAASKHGPSLVKLHWPAAPSSGKAQVRTAFQPIRPALKHQGRGRRARLRGSRPAQQRPPAHRGPRPAPRPEQNQSTQRSFPEQQPPSTTKAIIPQQGAAVQYRAQTAAFPGNRDVMEFITVTGPTTCRQETARGRASSRPRGPNRHREQELGPKRVRLGEKLELVLHHRGVIT